MKKLIILIITIIIFTSYSCAPTYTPVYPELVDIKTIIKPGDTAMVTTKDTYVHELKVVEITDVAIIGESEELLFTDINNIHKDTTSFEKKTLRVIGAAGIVTIIGIGMQGYIPVGRNDKLMNTSTFSSSQRKRPYRNVYPDALSIEMEIKPGDTIRVRTKGNKPEVYEFKVVEVTQDSILGESQKVNIKDILNLEKKL